MTGGRGGEGVGKPYYHIDDDGCLTLEWIYDNEYGMRYMIYFDPNNIYESAWNCVTKDFKVFESGYLPREFIDRLREVLKDTEP